MAEGREEEIRRVSEVMRERELEGHCGRKRRINNLSNSGHQIIKKVPNEIEFGLYKCNKVWLKIYQKKKINKLNVQ